MKNIKLTNRRAAKPAPRNPNRLRSWLIRGLALTVAAPLLVSEVMQNREQHPVFDGVGLAYMALPLAAFAVILLRDVIERHQQAARYGLVAVGLALSAVSVANSAMRQDAFDQAKIDVINGDVAARARASADIARLRADQKQIAATITKQCHDTAPGPICKGAKDDKATNDADIAKAEAALAGLSQVTTDAMGQGVMGGDPATAALIRRAQIWAIAALMNLAPLVAGAFLLHGVVAHTAPQQAPAARPGLSLVAANSNPPEPPKPGQRYTRKQAEADLLALTVAGAVPVERALAARWGMSLSYAQQIVAATEAAGLIVTFRQGRRLAYQLA